MKVLIIEDDSPLCWLLEKILHNKYEVIIMNNGMEAWSWLSDRNIPDLIISDIKMPSLDGIELLENLSISGLFKNIPVIMCSGWMAQKISSVETGRASAAKSLSRKTLVH